MSEQRHPQEVIERAETLVNRIQGVSSCRISTDEVGTITEIHVVALPHKAAKLVARDVESCLKAELGIEVDHRKIGVVVITAGRPEPDEDSDRSRGKDTAADRVVEFPVEEFASRFEFRSVSLFVSRDGLQAEVELARDGLEILGKAATDNPNTPPARVVAEAAVKAVSELLEESSRLCLAEVRDLVLGDDPAVVVKVDLVRNRDVKSLAGCSLLSGNVNQTVVFAALDAINRVIGKLPFRKSIEYRIK
jgi:hypothetical protein